MTTRPISSVTIDNLGIEVHERFAQDQAVLDVSYIRDSAHVASHFEVAATSPIYLSEWAQLFELDRCYMHFANFAPPPLYSAQKNHHFSNQILTRFFWIDQEEEEESFEDEEEISEAERDLALAELRSEENRLHTRCSELLRMLQQFAKPIDTVHTRFERDKTQLLDLLTLIRHLNTLLAFVQARRLQYQKG